VHVPDRPFQDPGDYERYLLALALDEWRDEFYSEDPERGETDEFQSKPSEPVS
jgi:hypothetical protein